MVTLKLDKVGLRLTPNLVSLLFQVGLNEYRTRNTEHRVTEGARAQGVRTLSMVFIGIDWPKSEEKF
jgi:hypothetical protein